MLSSFEHFQQLTGSPWLLTAATPERTRAYLAEQQLLQADEEIVEISPAGEGNMNLVLRIATNQRNFILKQSRPWVARFPDIAAPVARIATEQAYFTTTANTPALAAHHPAVLHYDAANYILLLTALEATQDMRYIYRAIRPLTMSAINQLADYLSTLHTLPVAGFPANQPLRQLNHDHIFVLPFQAENAQTVDAIGQPFCQDEALRQAAAALGQIYLQDGPHLVHGDFHPGSFLQRDGEVFVIDGEFAHPGRAEFDAGVMAAHLQLADLPWTEFLYRRYRKPADFDHLLVHRFRAVEILRRLLGVARVPIALSESARRELLVSAREMLVNDNPGRPGGS